MKKLLCVLSLFSSSIYGYEIEDPVDIALNEIIEEITQKQREIQTTLELDPKTFSFWFEQGKLYAYEETKLLIKEKINEPDTMENIKRHIEEFRNMCTNTNSKH